MDGRATPRNTASARCRWRRMFTNVRDDMGVANLPNVRGRGWFAGGADSAHPPLERGVVNFRINFEIFRWPREGFARGGTEIDGMKEPALSEPMNQTGRLAGQE